MEGCGEVLPVEADRLTVEEFPPPAIDEATLPAGSSLETLVDCADPLLDAELERLR